MRGVRGTDFFPPPYWVQHNSRKLYKKPRHFLHVTAVWWAVSNLGVIDQYFFKEAGVTVTVTSIELKFSELFVTKIGQR